MQTGKGIDLHAAVCLADPATYVPPDKKAADSDPNSDPKVPKNPHTCIVLCMVFPVLPIYTKYKTAVWAGPTGGIKFLAASISRIKLEPLKEFTL